MSCPYCQRTDTDGLLRDDDHCRVPSGPILARRFCTCHPAATKPCVECAGRGYTTPNPGATA